MSFKINYKEGKIVSVDKWFNGEMKNGRKFTVISNWNDWDGWSVDDVDLEGKENNDEILKDLIAEEFLFKMNG